MSHSESGTAAPRRTDFGTRRASFDADASIHRVRPEHPPLPPAVRRAELPRSGPSLRRAESPNAAADHGSDRASSTPAHAMTAAGKEHAMPALLSKLHHASRTLQGLRGQAEPKPAAKSVAAPTSDASREPGDWLAAAALFAIIGGSGALLLADWSMLVAALGACGSAALGILFAEV